MTYLSLPSQTKLPPLSLAVHLFQPPPCERVLPRILERSEKNVNDANPIVDS